MANVIFAIDRHVSANFVTLTALETIIRERGGKKLQGKYTHKDGTEVYERSYLVSEDVWFKHFAGQPYVSEQESILIVSECNKQYAHLRYLDGVTPDEHLGCLTHVAAEDAREAPAWSYDPLHNRFFICTENSQSSAPAEDDAVAMWKLFDQYLADIEYRGAYGPHVRRFAEDLKELVANKKPRWIK